MPAHARPAPSSPLKKRPPITATPPIAKSSVRTYGDPNRPSQLNYRPKIKNSNSSNNGSNGNGNGVKKQRANPYANINERMRQDPRAMETGWDTRFIHEKTLASTNYPTSMISKRKNNPSKSNSTSANNPASNANANSNNEANAGNQVLTKEQQLSIKKSDATNAVNYRESLLSQLAVLVKNWPAEPQTSASTSASAIANKKRSQLPPQSSNSKGRNILPECARALTSLSLILRTASLSAVEKIVGYTLSLPSIPAPSKLPMSATTSKQSSLKNGNNTKASSSSSSSAPQPFLHNNDTDYLLKMYTDTDYVSATIGAKTAQKYGNFSLGNPILLSKDEIMGGSNPSGGGGSGGGGGGGGRVNAGGLDVVRRERRRVSEIERVEKDEREEIERINDVREGRVDGVIREDVDGEEEGEEERYRDRDKSKSASYKNLLKSSPEPAPSKNQATNKTPRTPRSPNIPHVHLQGGSQAIASPRRVKSSSKFSAEILEESKLDESKEESKEEMKSSGRKRDEEEVYDEDSFDDYGGDSEAFEEFDEHEESKSEMQSPFHQSQVINDDVDVNFMSPSGKSEINESVDALEEFENSIKSTSKSIQDSILDQYTIGELLGEGAYGFVYSTFKKNDPRKRLAMKKFKPPSDDDEDGEDANYVMKIQEREVTLCRELRHVSIVLSTDNFVDLGIQYIVFEHMECNLLTLIENNPDGTSELTVQHLIKQLLNGLAFVHAKGIVHRDIKPENLLINDPNSSTPVLKICDFGAARYINENTHDNSNSSNTRTDLTHYVGSRWYRAPELLGSSTHYDCAVDVWSTACIFAELICGVALFQGDDEAEVVRIIQTCFGRLPKVVGRMLYERGVLEDVYAEVVKERDIAGELGRLGRGGLEVVLMMLNVEARARPRAEECLEHSYFSGVFQEVVKDEEEPFLSDDDDGDDYEQDHEDFEEEETEEEEEAIQSPTRIEKGITPTSQIWDILHPTSTSDTIKSYIFKQPTLDHHSSTPIIEYSTFISTLSTTTTKNFNTFLTSYAQSCNTSQAHKLADVLRGVVDFNSEGKVGKFKEWMLERRAGDDVTFADVGDYFEDVKMNDDRSSSSDLKSEGQSNVKAIEGLAFFKNANSENLNFKVKCDQGAFAVDSVNLMLSLISPLLLDVSVSNTTKYNALKAIEQALGYPNLLNPSSSSSSSSVVALSPSSNALMLFVRVTEGGVKRVAVTMFREEALSSFLNLLVDEGCIGGETKVERRKSNSNDDDSDSDDYKKAMVVNPYYRSPYGSKKSQGYAVEEGEGLGPRKEYFGLVSAQFLAVDGAIVKEGKRKKNGNEEDGFYVEECFDRFNATLVLTSSVASGAISPGMAITLTDVKGNIQKRTITSIDKTHIQLSKAIPEPYHEQRIHVSKTKTPILVYRQECEMNWINVNLAPSTNATLELEAFGVLIGMCIQNQATLTGLNGGICAIFWRLLLIDGYVCSVRDLEGFDDGTIAAMLEDVKRWSDAKIVDVLEMEGIDTSSLRGLTSSELVTKYIDVAIDNLFGSSIKWQIDTIRKGLTKILEKSDLTATGLDDPESFAVAICGPSQSPALDFDIRSTFNIILDAALTSNVSFTAVLWRYIDNLKPSDKRKLVLFITGVSNIPSKGVEYLTIDMPFISKGRVEHIKNGEKIPTSHTCDNVLELPNYWESVEKAWQDERRVFDTRDLEDEVFSVLQEKFGIALDNCGGGYGLDAIDSAGAGAGGGSLDSLLGRGGVESKSVEREDDEDDEDGGEASFNIPTMMDDDDGGGEQEEEWKAVPKTRIYREYDEKKNEGRERDTDDYARDSRGEEKKGEGGGRGGYGGGKATKQGRMDDSDSDSDSSYGEESFD